MCLFDTEEIEYKTGVTEGTTFFQTQLIPLTGKPVRFNKQPTSTVLFTYMHILVTVTIW